MPTAGETDLTSPPSERNATAQLAAVVQSSHDAIIGEDLDATITSWNRGAERLYGYRPDEAIGRASSMLLSARSRDAETTLLSRVVTGEHVEMVRTQRTHRSGAVLEVSLSVSPIVDAQGRIVGVSSASCDINDAVTPDGGGEGEAGERAGGDRTVVAPSAVDRSDALVRQITESIDIAIVLRNLDPPRYLYVSPGYQKIFESNPMADGEDPAEFLHRVAAEDRGRFESQYWQPSQAGLAAHCEYRVVRTDGTTRWIRSTSTPVPDADDVVRRCAAVAEDITDVKLAEAALRSADEARKANAAKNEFLSRMSHELRTPLNAVLGFAQLLEIDELTDEQHTAVKHILRGGRHLVSLIDDVLDIAKIESDRLDLSLEALSMSDLLGDTVALMMPMATAANVGLSFSNNEPVNQHVHGDSRRLRQVVLNLLSNAIKYNRPGGWAEVSCESAGGAVHIVVRDNGIGIPAEELPRLFTPFDRLGAQSSAIEGSGVGLALSHRLMTTMGGTLSATSELGAGSVFTASVPVATPAVLPSALPPAAMAADAREAMNEGQAPPRTLLYIEDTSSNIMLMEHLIGHRSQWRMITANTGTIGLHLAAIRAPDLVLLDLHLPDMDGIEVLHRLRSDPATSELRVVIVSADASPNQMNRLLAAGAYAYLTKPLDVARMLEVLDAFVAHSVRSSV